MGRGFTATDSAKAMLPSQHPAARERESSEGEEERTGHVEMPVTCDLERDERTPEVREHPARIRGRGKERPPNDERQQCIAYESGQLDGTGRFAQRRRGEERKAGRPEDRGSARRGCSTASSRRSADARTQDRPEPLHTG